MAGIAVDIYEDQPGTVRVVVDSAPTGSLLYRIEDSYSDKPVRNWEAIDPTGVVQIMDSEAPLGQSVTYRLVDSSGNLLAQSSTIYVPALESGKALLRSPLKPWVVQMEVEPQDEVGVTWTSSARAYEVIGSSTPVVVSEVRQRHSGTISFLCKSIAEANDLVITLRDGLPMLLRHDPCGKPKGRDFSFYALNVSEVRIPGSAGWRTIVVDYQSTEFVFGETEEPPFTWNFQELSGKAATFGELTALYSDFGSMAYDIDKVQPTQAAARAVLF
jgi:hypothetical protein